MENQKLTSEEIQQIKSIQEKNRAAVIELGELEIHANSIEQRKANVFKFLQELREEEQSFAKELTDKYGDGSINLDTGEFTPNPVAEEEAAAEE